MLKLLADTAQAECFALDIEIYGFMKKKPSDKNSNVRQSVNIRDK